MPRRFTDMNSIIKDFHLLWIQWNRKIHRPPLWFVALSLALGTGHGASRLVSSLMTIYNSGVVLRWRMTTKPSSHLPMHSSKRKVCPCPVSTGGMGSTCLMLACRGSGSACSRPSRTLTSTGEEPALSNTRIYLLPRPAYTDSILICHMNTGNWWAVYGMSVVRLEFFSSLGHALNSIILHQTTIYPESTVINVFFKSNLIVFSLIMLK